MNISDEAVQGRKPSRGGLIGNGPAMVPIWTSGELVSFAGPNGPWQRIVSASELRDLEQEVIADEAVEAAARGIYAMNFDPVTWDWKSNENNRLSCINLAREVLTSAAPTIVSEAMFTAAEVVESKGPTDGSEVALWLRAYGQKSSAGAGE